VLILSLPGRWRFWKAEGVRAVECGDDECRCREGYDVAGFGEGVDCDEWCGAVVGGQLYRGGSDGGLLLDRDDVRIAVADGGVWWGYVDVVGVWSAGDDTEWRGAYFGAAFCDGAGVSGVFWGLVGWCGRAVGLCEFPGM
jgi:hypothetical protein